MSSLEASAQGLLSGDISSISSKFRLADRDVEKSNYMRVEVDRLGQAPLRAVLAKRGQRPFDIDYARFIPFPPRIVNYCGVPGSREVSSPRIVEHRMLYICREV